MQRQLLIAERFYGALLNLYPASFRSVYASQMRLSFRDACRAAYSRDGAGGLLALWLPTLLDLFKSALEQRAALRERARLGEITMLKERFAALAGPLTILIGVLIMGGLIGELVWLVRPSEPLWEFFHFQLPTVAIFLMLPAFIATRLRFQEDAHRLGKLGLLLNVMGAGGLSPIVVAAFVLSALDPEPVRYDGLNIIVVVCALRILIGHILFGIDALRHKLMPRWNVLPLLIGLTFPLVGVISMIIPSVLHLDQSQVQSTLGTLPGSFTGLWCILMGLVMVGMVSQKQEPQPAPAV